MSNEMIERVAMEIKHRSIFVTGSELNINECREYSKAAIQVMREPTEEMKSHYMWHELKCWQEMIDAALKED